MGGAGLARGVNLVRGVESAELHWNDEALDRVLGSALTTYLAVAHYGRGRGQWSASEHPSFWREVIDAQLARHADALHEQWRDIRKGDHSAPVAIENLQHLLIDISEAVLQALYPQALAQGTLR